MAETLSSITVNVAQSQTKQLETVHDDATDRHTPGVEILPTIKGGLSTFRLISAATDNATVIKATAGKLYGYRFATIDATPVFVKFYDKASAPTSSDTPKITITVHGHATPAWDFPTSEFWTIGLEFANGIGIRVTTGLADSDTGAVAVNEVVGAAYYK